MLRHLMTSCWNLNFSQTNRAVETKLETLVPFQKSSVLDLKNKIGKIYRTLPLSLMHARESSAASSCFWHFHYVSVEILLEIFFELNWFKHITYWLHQICLMQLWNWLFESAEYAFLNIFGMFLLEKRVDFVIKHQQQGRMFHRLMCFIVRVVRLCT